jgi:hypothetical protein
LELAAMRKDSAGSDGAASRDAESTVTVAMANHPRATRVLNTAIVSDGILFRGRLLPMGLSIETHLRPGITPSQRKVGLGARAIQRFRSSSTDGLPSSIHPCCSALAQELISQFKLTSSTAEMSIPLLPRSFFQQLTSSS